MAKQPTSLEKQIGQYAEGWYRTMTDIWRDRLALLDIGHTGRLFHSVQGSGLDLSGTDLTAAFQFVDYGIYVDRGVGRGYTRGNGGDLKILDPVYRHEHGLGRARRKTLWFSRSWYISRRVFNEAMADLLGQAFVGAFDRLD